MPVFAGRHGFNLFYFFLAESEDDIGNDPAQSTDAGSAPWPQHYLDIRKSKQREHEVIQYCKAHQDKLIIEAIAVVFKDMRAKLGIEMKP